MDTCAGASIFPRGFDQSATDESTVAPVRHSTATDDPVHGDAGKKSCFGLRAGRKFQVRYKEADVSFPIVSIGEASQQGNWFVFGPDCQAMLPGSSGEFLRTCVKDPNAAKLEKHRGVYWLPCSATEHTDGAPLGPNPRTARLVVEAPPISVPDPDATPMQLEESEETCRPKHRALPANVSKEEFDSHQLAHLPSRSWCDHCVRGKAVDDAHRPRNDPHRGEAKMGMDYYFLARASDPQHAKAVLNCLDFQPGAVISAMVVKGGDPYALAVAPEAIKFTGRTRLIIMSDQENAVKNLVDMIRDSRTHETAVINTPKGSSASAGGIEPANYLVEKQIRTLRSRFEETYGESVGLDHKILPFLARHCAWLITHYQAKSDGNTPYERLRGRPYQGQVTEIAEVVQGRREGCRHAQSGRQMEPGLVAGKEPGIRRASLWHFGRVRRCRSIWRRPEKQRWDRKMSTEMNGEPWSPVPPKDKAPQVRGVYTPLERQIKHGGTKGCSTCFGQASSSSLSQAA